MRVIYALIPMSLLISCHYDGTTENFSNIFNNSSHIISYPIDSSGTLVNIVPNQKIKTKMVTGKGKSSGIDYCNFFLDFKSAKLVIYNGVDSIYHYYDTLDHTNGLNANHPRCLYNKDAYVKQFDNVSKRSQAVNLYYTFTEEDYKMARDKRYK